MSEPKITAAHLRRAAIVYVRQSTAAQLSRNRESTARQYDLVARAAELGWPRSAVRVIDDDLGVSGAGATGRSGFAELAAQVGLGQVGIVLALEVSRLARNNADWYRLLDLAGMTDTLIADADGIYHPGLFNDRMLLGMKGTMSEAELHILRARLDGGIRSKAARGELRRGLPVGLVWGEADGEIRWHPDEAVTGVHRRDLRAVRRVRVGARGVAVAARARVEVPAATDRLPARRRDHLGRADLSRGAQRAHPPRLRGRLRVRPDPPAPPPRRRRGAAGAPPQAAARRMGGAHHRPSPRVHRLGHLPGQPDSYPGQHPPDRRTSPAPARSARAARCCRAWPPAAVCGRKLAVYYDGPAKTTPGYYCTGTGQLVEGRGTRHLRVGGQAIDTAVTEAFLAALQPAALQACLAAAQHLEDGHDAALAQWRRQVEQARYRAGRAERRYRAVDPDNRLVARGLETEWNSALQALADAEAELARRETARPKTLTPQEKSVILALGRRPRRRVVGADHHRQGPQTPAAQPARRSQHQRPPRPPPQHTPNCCCAGRAARSPNCRCRSNANHPTGCAPTRTPSTWSAASPSTTPTR